MIGLKKRTAQFSQHSLITYYVNSIVSLFFSIFKFKAPVLGDSEDVVADGEQEEVEESKKKDLNIEEGTFKMCAKC